MDEQVLFSVSDSVSEVSQFGLSCKSTSDINTLGKQPTSLLIFFFKRGVWKIMFTYPFIDLLINLGSQRCGVYLFRHADLAIQSESSSSSTVLLFLHKVSKITVPITNAHGTSKAKIIQYNSNFCTCCSFTSAVASRWLSTLPTQT